jgi:hypothetical protein
MSSIEATPDFVARACERPARNIEVARGRVGRPLSCAALRPDRAATRDATVQMSLPRSITGSIPRSAVARRSRSGRSQQPMS